MKIYGSLAQLVEQLAFNQFVEGSNPSRPTTFQNIFILLLFNIFIDTYLNREEGSQNCLEQFCPHAVRPEGWYTWKYGINPS